jgi:hypothetical protein
VLWVPAFAGMTGVVVLIASKMCMLCQPME